MHTEIHSDNSRDFFSNIQALRGFAAVLVLLYHTHIVEAKYFGTHAIPAILGKVGTAGVDLFFVISGFVMVVVAHQSFGKSGSATRFLVRRAERIYPIYWFYSLIVLAVLLIRPQWVNASTGHEVNLLASFTLFPSGTLPLIMQGWTLTYEIFFYIVFALFIRCSASKSLPYWLIAWTIFTAFSFFFLRPVLSSPIVFVLTDPLVFEFIGGCLSALILRSLPPRCAPFLIVFGGVVFVFCIWIATRLPVETMLAWRALIFGLPAFFMVTCAAALEKNYSIASPRFLVFLGAASYSLYLSHILVISAVGRIWASTALPYLGPAMGTIACVTMAIAWSCLGYELIEKRLNAIFKVANAVRLTGIRRA